MKSDNIQVGSLVKSYHSGFHIVTRIIQRADASPIIYYTKVLDAEGKFSAKVKNCCDAGYITVVDEEFVDKLYAEDIDAANRRRNNLITLLTTKTPTD